MTTSTRLLLLFSSVITPSVIPSRSPIAIEEFYADVTSEMFNLHDRFLESPTVVYNAR
jgi:hypothetical protein